MNLKSFTNLFSYQFSFSSLHLILAQIINRLYYFEAFAKLSFDDDLIEQHITAMSFLLVIRIQLIDFIELILHFFVLIAHYRLISLEADSHCYLISFDLQIKALQCCF